MKKVLTAAIFIGFLPLSMMSVDPTEPDRLYANVVFTVFKLDSWPQDVEHTLNLPLPQVYEESWIHAFLSLDITDGSRQIKSIDKEDIRFEIAAGSIHNLSIHVFEKDQTRFYFEHHRPSTASYIFYGPDSAIYLMQVLYSIGDHPVGPLGPGIRR